MAPRTALRLACWATAFLAITVVGPNWWQSTGTVTASPAVAIAFVWLLAGSGAGRRVDIAAVLVLTLGAQLVQQIEFAVALVTMLALIGPIGADWLLRRWAPGLWGPNGLVPLRTLPQFGHLVTSVTAATFFAAVAETAAAVALLPTERVTSLPFHWGRSGAAMLLVAVVLLVVVAEMAERRREGLPVVARPRRQLLLEITAVQIGAGLVFYVGFVGHPQVPTTFALALAVVWAGMRFPVPLAAAHAVEISGVALILTNAGYGPMMAVEDRGPRMLLVLVFGVVMLLVGLVVSLTRHQYSETIRRLHASEEALTARAAELDQILENLEDGVAIVEETGRVVHANTAVAHMLTGEEDAPEGEGISDEVIEPAERYHLFHPDGRPLKEHEMPYARALRGEVVTAHEYHLRHPRLPGTKVLEINAFHVEGPPDAPRRAMVTVRDVTAARAQREALTTFAGVVAHDLNSPLSVIDGWAEALEEEFEAGDAVESTTGAPMVRHIRSSARMMSRFISDLLTHAVARDQALTCEVVDLDEVVGELVGARVGPESSLSVSIRPLGKVWADRSLIRQLVDNLLGNAIKYVSAGQDPRVVVTTEQAGTGWLRLQVSDNGIGVPAEQREQIFDTFHRATGDRTGTGLGLSICRRIAERHGGTISVRDNPGGSGSCFEVLLPRTADVLARVTRR